MWYNTLIKIITLSPLSKVIRIGVVVALIVFAVGVGYIVNARSYSVHTFFNKRTFYQFPDEIVKTPNLEYGSAIIPHHVVASKLIHHLLWNLPDDISTIYIIAPNHEELGIAMQTSNLDWQTAFGVLDVDQNKVVSLIRNVEIVNEPDIIASDQGVAALTDYISYHFPNVKIVPILLKAGLDNDKLDSLVLELSSQKDAFFLFSVDFSHYLDYKDALEHDKKTYSLLKYGSAEDFRGLSSDFLDSDSAIMLLKRLNDMLGFDYMRLLDHSTNFDITGSGEDFNNITSYFTVLFSKGI